MHALYKAFDTVNHSTLLDKLSYYGVKGQTNKWFENFIPERYQYTSIKECKSEKPKLTGSLIRISLTTISISPIH